MRNQYNSSVVKAVQNALGEEFKNVYVLDNNVCGIYIPIHRKEEFNLKIYERKYEENVPLYTYDTCLKHLKIM